MGLLKLGLDEGIHFLQKQELKEAADFLGPSELSLGPGLGEAAAKLCESGAWEAAERVVGGCAWLVKMDFSGVTLH